MAAQLFRAEAVDSLTAPDQLDQQMRVVDPKRWIALVAVSVLLLGTLIWAFVGRIDSTVQAPCVLIPRGGTYNVVSPASGTVYDVLVGRGDDVEEGQAVAVIETPDRSRVRVLAPFSGTVVELLATYGDFVPVGDKILNFESDEEPLGILLYLPPAVTAQLAKGIEVRVAPVTASRDQWGFLLAKIDEVAPYPSTWDGISALLNNEALANELVAGTGGAPVEVWVAPDPASTPTGFRWSSSNGPPSLRAGTVCTADIVLAAVRPIDLVRP